MHLYSLGMKILKIVIRIGFILGMTVPMIYNFLLLLSRRFRKYRYPGEADEDIIAHAKDGLLIAWAASSGICFLIIGFLG